MLEDSVLNGSRIVTHLASILLLLHRLPKFLSDPQNLDLLPGKIKITVPCLFEEIVNLYLHIIMVCPTNFLPKH